MILNRMCGGQDPINSSPEKLALQGYDPVAYFTMARAMKGDPEFRHDWMGAIWQFLNHPHRQMFMATPEKFSPQFGGYCAYGISLGKFFNGDPQLWTVKEGKLYLNLNQEIAKVWKQDAQTYIKKAEIEWPNLMG